ncbi:MAG: metal-dependent hydrolase [Desulfobacterales bacterium]|nr:MAG: metal-dependent hydrolase [Desulfobacterales bacterium]
MPSVLTHAAVAVAGGIALAPREVPHHFWPLAILCATVADADVLGFSFDIPYHHFFGHRGFFHSPFWGLLLSLCLTAVFFRDVRVFSAPWGFYFFFFFFLAASHGILDALTDGGLGIALLSPFDNQRHFFPWTPIQVAPLRVEAFFSPRGWSVFKSELLWIWLPAFMLLGLARIIRMVVARH